MWSWNVSTAPWRKKATVKNRRLCITEQHEYQPILTGQSAIWRTSALAMAASKPFTWNTKPLKWCTDKKQWQWSQSACAEESHTACTGRDGITTGRILTSVRSWRHNRGNGGTKNQHGAPEWQKSRSVFLESWTARIGWPSQILSRKSPAFHHAFPDFLVQQ